jgi:proteasome lid subunit RPN8/RPN11
MEDSLYISIGLVLLLGVVLFIYLTGNSKKEQKSTPITTPNKTNNTATSVANNTTPQPSNAGDTSSQRTSRIQVQARTRPADSSVQESNYKSNGQIVIKSSQKRITQISESAFLEHIEANNYVELGIDRLWMDTIISHIYLSEGCIIALDKMLKEENVNRRSVEMDGLIPEIGGFLLGKYMFSEASNQYQITLEQFVPIAPEKHDVYQIEFSTDSIVKELGGAQDKFPTLTLMGWFHTHPGHGLFLSKPDLNIHEGFFHEKYQVAMEIDSLSDNLDTGFFTNTKRGKVNNCLRERRNWFSWTHIEQEIGLIG